MIFKVPYLSFPWLWVWQLINVWLSKKSNLPPLLKLFFNVNYKFNFLGPWSGRICCARFFNCQFNMTDQTLQDSYMKNLETKNKSSLKILTAKFTSRGTSTSADTWTTMFFSKITQKESRGNVNLPTKKSTKTSSVICSKPTRWKNLRFSLHWKKILNAPSALNWCVCREEFLLVIVNISSAQSV